MYMAYSTNPKLPKLRMEAVMKVHSGAGIRAVARYYGYQPSTVMRWVKRADRDYLHGANTIPTESSRPKSHPDELSDEVVQAILDLRKQTRRGAEFIHHILKKDGVKVSLSSVKRTLRRHGLTKYSKWKKWHSYPPRPLPSSPGQLVQIDTIHDGAVGSQLYIYTLLDVCSRWAYAAPAERITNRDSLRFTHGAVATLPFKIKTLQSDHGPEFAKWYSKQLTASGISHRHSRVRTPNDNAHLERFNRTIQEECISRLSRNLKAWGKGIPEYLHYYNHERPHMGLNWQTPEQVLRSY